MQYNPKLLLVVLVALLVVCDVSARLYNQKYPSQAMIVACNRTQYNALCVNSLLDFPGANAASSEELVDIALNITLQRVRHELDLTKLITNLDMDAYSRSAYDDCLELLEDSVDLLTSSLASVTLGGKLASSTDDVLTWLSAALTNQDTCVEGFGEVVTNNSRVKSMVANRVNNTSKYVTNSLNLYAAYAKGIPCVTNQTRRRLLLDEGNTQSDFPMWVSQRERVLLEMPVSAMKFDLIVSKSGRRGSYKTIAEAFKKAPSNNKIRFTIFVSEGRYEEPDLKVGTKKTNIMLVGAGRGKTVITGGKSVADHVTTFHTASFAATGAGFIARDITFENTAGPAKYQAVALRVGADLSVVFRCSIIGYQDTLYVHSNRQFYRDCDIYGTVDFIFGNAAVVFQGCTMYARKPMLQQKITITAQGRKNPSQTTGISIHNCRIVAERDLEASKAAFPTYLGRPWKMYSRTVIMRSFLGDHIHPAGWLEWDGNFALNTLYYGEYMNNGTGSWLGKRVKWGGYHVISKNEARRFTLANFISGLSWLPWTGVDFYPGL